MRNINQLVKNNNLGQGSATSTTPTGKIDHNVKILINMIFARFQAIYGNRFDQMFADDDTLIRAKREWALAIVNLNEQQIVNAIEQCKQKCKWPPSIAEFLEFGKADPSSLGLPDVKQAYQQAIRCRQDPFEYTWSHPIVYWAAHETGFHTLKTETEAKSFAIFSDHYQRYVDKVSHGQEFNLPGRRVLEQQTDSSTQQILATAAKLGLDDKQAWQLLIYMEKPEGSASRKAYRAQAMKKAIELGLQIELPE